MKKLQLRWRNALERAAEMGKDGIDPEGDYEVDEKQRSCTLTDEGFTKARGFNWCGGSVQSSGSLGPLHHQRPEGQRAVCEVM